MKEFNLELAKAGHPLITRDGVRVVQFVHYEEPFSQRRTNTLTTTMEGGGRNAYYIDGRFLKGCDSDEDLFLDDSVEWHPGLKIGDVVEVSDDGMDWKERIFLFETDGTFNTVACGQEARYKRHHEYSVSVWKHCRPIKSPEIKITVEINGKRSKLSDLSDETIQKIKELESD